MEKRFHRIGCLVALALIVAALLFGKDFRTENTANTIKAAHHACEAQMGQRCS